VFAIVGGRSFEIAFFKAFENAFESAKVKKSKTIGQLDKISL